MAQEQALPGIDIPRSMSDRPLVFRWWIYTGRFFRDKPLGGFGVIIIALLVLAAVAAPWVSRYDPTEIFFGVNPDYDAELAEQALSNPNVRLQNPPEVFIKDALLRAEGPSPEHWLGTDSFGHDLYSRLIYGARVSLRVGIGASLVATVFGTIFAIISAYFGGKVDMIIQRLVDTLQAIPGLILLLLFTQVMENPTLNTITIALGILGFAPVIRIVRSDVLQKRQMVYVLAAESVGASNSRMMVRHILPNIVAPIIVIFTISIGLYVLFEATLQFLGLGDASSISWGKMVNQGRLLGSAKPLMALFSGLAITMLVVAFNLAGDAIRDVLDPRLRGGGGRPGF
jgi:peptide/nickel transport system permease protein